MKERANALRVEAGAAGVRLFRFSHVAMGTTFGVVAAHEDPGLARSGADIAFDEVDDIERDLSRFIETSDVTHVTALRAGEATIVGPDAFECLRLAGRVQAETGGAFDPAIGALFAAWFPQPRREGEPDADELDRAVARTGLGLLELGEGDLSVRAKADDVALDLGGIGKGWALDRAAELLRDWGVSSALIHAGESTCLAVGPPPGGGAWRMSLRDPRDGTGSLDEISLEEGRAVSGSGVPPSGLHIIDPRTCRPADARPAAWAFAPGAALSDALSTAFMVMSEAEVEAYCEAHEDVSAVLASDGPGGLELRRFGRVETLGMEPRTVIAGTGQVPLPDRPSDGERRAGARVEPGVAAPTGTAAVAALDANVWATDYRDYVEGRSFAGDRHRILLACFPKSGSTYLARILSLLPGWSKAPLVTGYGRREQELSVERLLEAHRTYGDYVAQHHVRYSDVTRRLMERFGLKPVVLVRNVFDTVVSVGDHLRGELPAISQAYVPGDLKEWDDERVHHFIADMVMPWYLNFFASWADCPEKLLVTYEELHADAFDIVRRIGDHYGLGLADDEVRAAVDEAATSGAETRRNRAVIGRGGALPDQVRSKVVGLTRYYRGVDFTSIGL